MVDLVLLNGDEFFIDDFVRVDGVVSNGVLSAGAFASSSCASLVEAEPPLSILSSGFTSAQAV